jgi:hypothetical protein
MSPDYAPQLDNFLIQPGKLVMRGPLVVTADLSSWYPLNVCGASVTNTGALIGRKNASAAGQVDPWNAPLLLPAASGLAAGLTTGLWVIGGTETAYSFASADYIPGPRWINFDGTLYGISYDSGGTPVPDAASSYNMKPLSLCTLTKSAPGGSPTGAPSTYANNSASGTNAWTVGSPSSATSPVQSQTMANPGSWLSQGGGVPWTLSGNFEAQFTTTPATSAQLWLTDWGFSIPSNATIVGVEVQLGQQASPSPVYHNVDGVQLIFYPGLLEGNVEGSGYVIPDFPGGTMTLGGSTDLWGNASLLTPGEVNSTSFGLAYWVAGCANATDGYEISFVQGRSMTVYYTLPEDTEYLEATGLGFALPSTAVVQGIAVTVTRDATATSNDAAVQLVKGGAIQSTNRSTGTGLPGSMTAQTFGGATDLWGTTWAYSDINASNFGAVYQALSSGTVNVQSITIQVWWTAGASQTITVLNLAPHGAFDLIGYQSRIWLLGGIDTPGSGTTHSAISLFFTNPIAAGGGSSSSDWKDPVYGTTNLITMDGDTSDYGVGLGTVRNGLVILRRASVYLLKGTTTANYTLIPISRDVGCMDARSIVEADEGVYFVSQEGLMLTNGTTVSNVSGATTHTLQAAIAAQQKAIIAGHGGYITCGRTSHGQILLSIGVGAPTAGSYAPIYTALYDPDAPAKGGAWVRITSDVWSTDGTQNSGNNYCGQVFDYKAPKRLLALGDRYVTAIQDQSVGLSMMDYNSGLYDQLPSGADPYVPIPAVWQTIVPTITTAAKRTQGQTKRYYIDYQFSAANLQPASGWSLQPVNSNAVALDALQNVPLSSAPTLTGPVSGVTPVPGAFIDRYNRDFWNEVIDTTFVVTWQDIARAQQAGSSVAEIYGMGTEFQHSRELGHG